MEQKLTFVVPDLHGRYDLLKLALRKIADYATTGKVVFTGDYVDRGPDSRSIVVNMIAGPPEGWSWVNLRGNHEDMMAECALLPPTADNYHWWLSNGGKATLDSYVGHHDIVEHIEWMKNLPTIHHDAYRVYVHAGVSESYDIDQQPESITQWYRYPPRADIGYRGRHVVHGHTIVLNPELYTNRTNLDTGAVFHGLLFVGVFHDEIPGGPIDLIEVSV